MRLARFARENCFLNLNRVSEDQLIIHGNKFAGEAGNLLLVSKHPVQHQIKKGVAIGRGSYQWLKMKKMKKNLSQT